MSRKLGSVPEVKNWVTEGKVTSVKSQGDCGSCWAFASLALAESVLIINSTETVDIDLSEQFLVECTQKSTCNGTFYMRYGL